MTEAKSTALWSCLMLQKYWSELLSEIKKRLGLNKARQLKVTTEVRSMNLKISNQLEFNDGHRPKFG